MHDRSAGQIQNPHFLSAGLYLSTCFVVHARNRLRTKPASPNRPVPTKPKVDDSGTAGGSAAGARARGAANRENEAGRSDGVTGGGGATDV